MKLNSQGNESEVESALDYGDRIIATLREPFLVLDKNLRIVSANQSFYTTFKVAEKNVAGQLLYDLGNRQWNIPDLLRLLKEIIPEKTVVKDYEVEHEFEDIGHRIMIMNARQLRASKKMAGLIAEDLILLAIEDVTERKFLQAELKNAEERYRRAFETSHDGLLLVHKTEGDILNSNAAAQELLGYSPEEFLKKKLWGIGMVEDDKGFQDLVSRLERDGVVHFDETPVKTSRGLSINSEVFLVDKAKVIQCNIRDITERKKHEAAILQSYVHLKEAQQKLIQMEKMAAVGRFSANIAHEVKNPLAIMLGGLEFLEMKLPRNDKAAQDTMDITKRAVIRANSILESLLSYSKPSESKIETINASEIAQPVIDMIAKNASLSNIAIDTDFEQEIKVSVDKGQMHQALLNLLTNSIASMPDGGKISIKIYQTIMPGVLDGKKLCVLEVADTGSGISVVNIRNVSEPFFTTKVRGVGTGLGLYITKMIIENHHGNMLIESSEGKGTVVKIVLPLVE